MNTSLNDRIALFCECFGDTEETANAFFSCSDILNISIYNGDRLAAMASLIPILALDKAVSGYYVYGVCVAPDMRGRGLFKEIMQKAESKAKSYGASFVCLIPAEERLANTYRKMGYTIFVHQRFDGYVTNRLKLDSEDFRNFAKCESKTEVERQKGLLKFVNTDLIDSDIENFSFLDDMGDV